MKAILFITASCLLHTALAAPDHQLKVHKHKDSAVTKVMTDMENYLEAEGSTPEAMTESAAAKESENVDAFGLPLSSNTPFPPDVPSFTSNWKKVGYLDMSDPTQQCPPSWIKIPSPRASCGKKVAGVSCDSLTIGTSGASYQTVCGRFRGYQVASTDAFGRCSAVTTPNTIEDPYVDGISITYGSPGSRKHIFTYAAGYTEVNAGHAQACSCPCTGGRAAPSFVGSDFYCESGNTGTAFVPNNLFSADVLWDGQECRSLETTCCNPPNLAWFCKTFPTPISGDMEVRICTDESLDNENVALEFFELFIK